ncbi:helix-turn-helix domain-containing protein [Bacillus subtilis]|uniref:Helix-turn-helix domain-containing protein n=2 Tax=Bacillaceae TaxID=186817 RepID=A0A9Q4EV93_9BACI|nr:MULTISPECIES: helix-turn-helix domain-containing protein [Bacillus]KUP41766.1 XRE family transcriptional regulator [Bacillus halotolerans]MCY9230073.1 helix-turn-helix domain-containing protein [Bacillus inaquosorum]MEC0520936.1 helix-turn-helix domain-containing protein [Bacillus inaquosorum]PRP56802.1 transcriptional regulator [Bacillus halotolerans]TQJ99271.1 putative transcriptional regulator [Bacillus sp. SJZ110]
MEREVLFSLRGNTSRTVVANDLNITPQMLGAIERGDRTPSLSLAKKIADYYGTTVDEIFFTQSRHKMCPKYKTRTDKGA